MGKKRRILTRTTKFSKKYFGLLDKIDSSSNVIDSAEVDDLIEVGDAFVDSIAVVDNENETVTVTGRILGGGHTTGKVELSVDGGGWGDATDATRDAGAGGLDEITYSIAKTLTKGAHTVRVRVKDQTNEALYSETKSIDVRENKITLGGLATAFVEDGDNIKFVSDQLTVSGKKAGGSGTDAALGNSSNFAIKIEILNKARQAQTLTGAGNSITLAKAGNYGNNSLNDPHMLAANVGGDKDTVYTFTVRLTPFDATTDALLEDSAVEHELTVTKD